MTLTESCAIFNIRVFDRRRFKFRHKKGKCNEVLTSHLLQEIGSAHAHVWWTLRVIRSNVSWQYLSNTSFLTLNIQCPIDLISSISMNEKITFRGRAVVKSVRMLKIYGKTIEIRQRNRIFKACHCSKVHNAPFKLASPISVSHHTSTLLCACEQQIRH